MPASVTQLEARSNLEARMSPLGAPKPFGKSARSFQNWWRSVALNDRSRAGSASVPDAHLVKRAKQLSELARLLNGFFNSIRVVFRVAFDD